VRKHTGIHWAESWGDIGRRIQMNVWMPSRVIPLALLRWWQRQLSFARVVGNGGSERWPG
jgi:hypothetical protein